MHESATLSCTIMYMIASTREEWSALSSEKLNKTGLGFLELCL